MTKVVITRKIPKAGIILLEKKFNNIRIISEGDFCSRESLLKEIKDADALLSLLTEKIDKEIINTGKKLKIIANYAVGYNNIDIDYAAEKGISVTNTPDILTETTADLAIILLASAARRIVEADKFTRAGKFRSWGPELLCGRDIHGKTLGIIGLGKIGKAVAKRAALGFGMKIFYSDESEQTGLLFKAERTDLNKLLKESDFISLHVPLTDSTHHLIAEKEFSLMKPTAIFINTSRGPVVDESALIRVLQEKKIYAAGLDVYEKEPTVPQKLRELDNVILAPHIGSASIETRNGMAVMAAQNIIDFFNGKTPQHIVN